MAKNKFTYMVTYGLALHFQMDLLSCISKTTCFDISYDESLSKILQNEQVDAIIHFWYEKTNPFQTWYFQSLILRRPNAEDLC